MGCSLVKFNGRTFSFVKCEATHTAQFCPIEYTVCAEHILVFHSCLLSLYLLKTEHSLQGQKKHPLIRET